MWGKAVAVLLVVAGTAACSGPGGAEDGATDGTSGRMKVRLVPQEGVKLPAFRDPTVDVAIAEGGDLVSIDVELGDFRGSNAEGPDAEIVLEDRARVYFRFSAGPKRWRETWVRFDVDEFDEAQPLFAGFLEFAKAERLLSPSSSRLDEEVVGEQTIRGVETTMYEARATVDDLVELATLPAEVIAAAQAITRDRIRITTWRDDDGYVHRLTFPIEASFLAPRAVEGVVLYQWDVTDHGEEVDVQLPDRDDVVPY